MSDDITEIRELVEGLRRDRDAALAEVERLRAELAELADGAHERGETCHVCRGAALAKEEP